MQEYSLKKTRHTILKPLQSPSETFKKHQESFFLTRWYYAIPGQHHILGVPPCYSLHRRVQPERLSDAHGGEGKIGQILPLDKCTHMYIHI